MPATPSLHITIFGASRGVGRATVDAALAAGHTVTAFSRTSASLAGSAAAVIAGDVLDGAAVAQALAGADAAIVALGVSPGRGADTPQDVCSRGTQTIVAAMQAHAIERLVVVTSYGVGETRTMTPFPFSVIAKTVLRGIMEDKERQETDVRASGLEWTIVQPLGLTDTPATGRAFVAADGARGTSRVSRADVAAVCIDAVEHAKYIGASIAVSTAK
jgi:putative NADH-flavin reductase